MIREAKKEIEKENFDAMDSLEKQLLELWKKASTLGGESESQRERKEAAMDVNLTQGANPQTDNPDKKEDTKPLKISFH